MKSKQLILLLSFLLVGCATNTYNVPFVDSKETVMLTAGMSRDDVLNEMQQQPLYVEYGNKDSGEIFWVYEVRSREVKSNLLPNSGMSPNKDHNIKRPTNPIHRLRLEFRDDQLYRWQPLKAILEEEVIDTLSDLASDSRSPKDTIYVMLVEGNSKLQTSTYPPKPTKKKSKKTKHKNSFFMETGLTAAQSNVDLWAEISTRYEDYGDNNYYNFDCYECYSDKSVAFNSYIGVENKNGRWGFEFTGSKSFLGMGIKRELLNLSPTNINLIFGFGIYSMSRYLSYNDDEIEESMLENIDSDQYEYSNLMSDLDNGYSLRSNSSMELTGFGVAKIGIGKQINFNNMILTPRYEMIIGGHLIHSFSIAYKIR